MPNEGRIVIAASTVLAVAAAVGFAVVVSGRPDVHVDGGVSWCMASTGSGTTVFGLYVENDGDKPVTLDSIQAGESRHLASVDYSVLPPRSIRSRAIEVGTDDFSDVAGWSSRRPVAGAPVPGHTRVGIVVFPRLANGADSGNVHDFTIRMTASGGVQHAYLSQTNVGFYPARDKSMPGCDR